MIRLFLIEHLMMRTFSFDFGMINILRRKLIFFTYHYWFIILHIHCAWNNSIKKFTIWSITTSKTTTKSLVLLVSLANYECNSFLHRYELLLEVYLTHHFLNRMDLFSRLLYVFYMWPRKVIFILYLHSSVIINHLNSFNSNCIYFF